jgi:hypothetical protein
MHTKRLSAYATLGFDVPRDAPASAIPTAVARSPTDPQ